MFCVRIVLPMRGRCENLYNACRDGGGRTVQRSAGEVQQKSKMWRKYWTVRQNTGTRVVEALALDGDRRSRFSPRSRASRSPSNPASLAPVHLGLVHILLSFCSLAFSLALLLLCIAIVFFLLNLKNNLLDPSTRFRHEQLLRQH